MKKIMGLALVLALLFIVSGCGKEDNNTTSASHEESHTQITTKASSSETESTTEETTKKKEPQAATQKVIQKSIITQKAITTQKAIKVEETKKTTQPDPKPIKPAPDNPNPRYYVYGGDYGDVNGCRVEGDRQLNSGEIMGYFCDNYGYLWVEEW